jgi:hypothetical protein
MRLTHADILAALQAEYPGDSAANQQGGVFLVARLKDAAIGMDDPAPHIFLPDCHLVTKSGAKRFPRVTADEPQVAALERFLRLVRTLAGQDSSLTFWQLGDLVDLWRVERTAKESSRG